MLTHKAVLLWPHPILIEGGHGRYAALYIKNNGKTIKVEGESKKQVEEMLKNYLQKKMDLYYLTEQNAIKEVPFDTIYIRVAILTEFQR